MEQKQIGIGDHLRTSLVEMAREYGIRSMWLFGSRARGDNRPRSDIDLAVTGGKTVDFAVDLDEKIPTLLMFDVVNLDKPVQRELLEEIARDGVLLYEKSGEF